MAFDVSCSLAASLQRSDLGKSGDCHLYFLEQDQPFLSAWQFAISISSWDAPNTRGWLQLQAGQSLVKLQMVAWGLHSRKQPPGKLHQKLLTLHFAWQAACAAQCWCKVHLGSQRLLCSVEAMRMNSITRITPSLLDFGHTLVVLSEQIHCRFAENSCFFVQELFPVVLKSSFDMHRKWIWWPS